MTNGIIYVDSGANALLHSLTTRSRVHGEDRIGALMTVCATPPGGIDKRAIAFLADGFREVDTGPARDTNGNTVGRWTIYDGEEDHA